MVICAESFIAKLESLGLKYSTHDLDNGGTCISVMFDGRSTNVFFDGDDNGTHVALRTVFENCPADRIADMLIVCNSLNCRFRWVKFCVDKDNDIMVEDDAIVEPESAGEECMELLARTVGIIKDAKPTIMRAIYS